MVLSPSFFDGAYPRERGGTQSCVYFHRSSLGLSPRARGNPADRQAVISAIGPIPASAGEPKLSLKPMLPQGAYPRERGGTSSR